MFRLRRSLSPREHRWLCHTIFFFDQYEEERLGGKSFGSTKSGIAPFYSDKYAKIGFQVSELFDEEHDGGGDNSGGLYIFPSAGVSLPVARKTSIHVGVGYTYNRAKYEFSYIPGTGSLGRDSKRFNAGGLTLSVGFSF